MKWLQNLPALTVPRIEQRRFWEFLLAFGAVSILLGVVLRVVGQFSIRTYFLLAFVWFLVCSEVFAPREPEFVWWSRLQWVKLGGWIVLVYIVYERILAIVG